MNKMYSVWFVLAVQLCAQIGKAEAQLSMSVRPITSNEVIATWSVLGGDKVRSLDLTFTKSSPISWTTVPRDPGSQYYHVTDLESGSFYFFRLEAVSVESGNKLTTVTHVKTPPYGSGRPENVTASLISDTSILVLWIPIEDSDTGAYLVSYVEVDANDNPIGSVKVHSIFDEFETILEHQIKKGSRYRVQVAALFRHGEGQNSPPVFVGSKASPEPKIVVAPKNHKVGEQMTAILVCKASGIPTPNIIWRKAGKRLNKRRFSENTANGLSVLRIEPVVALKDKGKYVCIAENGVGKRARARAVLTTYKGKTKPKGYPVITKHPILLYAERGSHVVINCLVSGKPRPKISWFKDGFPIDLSTDYRLTVYGNGSLRIPYVKDPDAGVYQCAAENKVGFAVSYSGQLYVEAKRIPPFFTRQGDDVEVQQGSDVSLTCAADGMPMPNVTWFKQDVAITRQKVGQNILMLKGVQMTSPYTCVAINTAGRIEKVFNVEVRVKPEKIEPPKFKSADTRIRILYGSDVNLTCETEGVLPTYVHWEKNGQSVTGPLKGRNILTLTNVQAQGSYTCVAENILGKIKNVYNIGFERKAADPTITSPPEEQKVLEQGTALFRCNATGYPLSRLTWERNGHGINFDNPRFKMWLKNGSTVLRIDYVNVDDAGVYTCVATNDIFQTTANYGANLVVYKTRELPDGFPEITENPTLIEKARGSFLTCGAAGYPEPMITWYKAFYPIVNTSEAYQEGANLYFKTLDESADGMYQCSASNDKGVVFSEPTKVYVKNRLGAQGGKPRVKEVRVSPGSNVNLTCVGIGSPIPSVRWQYKGQNLETGGSHVLQLVDVQESKNYTCVAFGSGGRTEASFIIIVEGESTRATKEKPVIRPAFSSHLVFKGNDFNLTCSTGPAFVLFFKWYRNGEFLWQDNTGENANRSVLQLENLKKSANYTCKAIGLVETAEAEYIVRVVQPYGPVISDPPRNISAAEGETAIFNCHVEGKTSLTVDWERNGKIISPDSTNGVFEKNGLFQLRISPVSVQNRGVYKCRASDDEGFTAMKEAHLKVYKRADVPDGYPKFIKHPEDQIAEIGTVLVFTCAGIGNPPVNIRWYKDHFPLETRNTRIIIRDGRLVIQNTMKSDGATYQCSAENDVGFVLSKPAVLHVKENETTPPVASITSSSGPEPIQAGSDVNLTCIAAGWPLPFVKWQYNNRDLSDEQAPQGGNVLMIRNVHTSKNYTCVAYNSNGESKTVYEVKVEGSQELKTGQSLKSHVKRIKVAPGSYVNLTCISSQPSDTIFKWRLNGKIIPNVYGTLLHLRDVRKSGNYTCTAVSRTGRSQAVFEVIVEENAVVPSAVTYLESTNRGTNHVILKWGEPDQMGGDILGYGVGHRQVTGTHLGNIVVAEQIDDSKQTKAFIGGLRPDTTYRMFVWANNNHGQGDAAYIDVRTAGRSTPIVKPKILEVVPSPSSVNVSWTASDNRDSRVAEAYYLEYRRLGTTAWQRGGKEESFHSWQQISGLDHETMYEVQVIGKYGGKGRHLETVASDKETFVTTGAAPEIVIGPQTTKVEDGNPVRFFCHATGDPTPLVYWEKNGQRIDGNRAPARYFIHSIDGASIFEIDPVRAGKDEGTVTCVAKGVRGQDNRYSAELVIYNSTIPFELEYPTITGHPEVTVIEEGRNGSMQCEFIGTENALVHWYKDRFPVEESNWVVITQKNFESRLWIVGAEESDEGLYQCSVENDAGTVFSKSSRLYVRVRRVPPVITVPPESKQVIEGSDVDLTCVGTGVPMPDVRWQHNQQNVPDNFPRPARNTLSLTDVRESRNYTCVVYNSFGTVRYRAEVKVLPKEVLPSSPGKPKVLDLTSNSATFQWTESTSSGSDKFTTYILQISECETGFGSTTDKVMDTGDSTELTVSDLESATCYKVRVIGQNTFGQGPFSPEETFVTNTSAAPRNVQAHPVSARSILVKWEEPAVNTDNLQEYAVYSSTNISAPDYAWKRQTVARDNPVTTISGLTLRETYYIRVESVFADGTTGTSKPVTVSLAPSANRAPSSVQNVDIEIVSPTSLRVSLESRGDEETIEGYELYVDDSNEYFEKIRINGAVSSYLVTGLTPGVEYIIRVAPRSQYGEGTKSIPYKIRLPIFVLEAPILNSVSAINTTAILIKWRPSTRDSEPENAKVIRGYVVFVEKEMPEKEPETDRKVFHLKQKQRELIVGGLNPGTKYSVTVSAFTLSGDGPSSDPQIVETRELNANAPSIETVSPVNKTAIFIKWRPSQNRAIGNVFGYYIYVEKVRAGPWDPALRYIMDVRPGNQRDVVMGNLLPGEQYRVEVAAYGVEGEGPKSLPMIVQTESLLTTSSTPIAVPKAPILMDVDVINSTTIAVSWVPPAVLLETAVIQGYYVYIEKLENGRWVPLSRYVTSIPPEGQIFMIDNLLPETEYRISITAFSQNGEGSPSDPIVILTTDDNRGTLSPQLPAGTRPVPDAPILKEVRGINTTSILVKWQRSPFAGKPGKIGGYYLYAEKYDHGRWKPEFKFETRAVSSVQQIVINGLEPGTKYRVKVSAFSSSGEGPKTDPKAAETRQSDVTDEDTNLSQENRPRAPTGFCQIYLGTACSKYLKNKSVFVLSKFAQGRTEEKVIAAVSVLGSSSITSLLCAKMAIESVCYTAFPPCIAEGNQPRPRQICQPDCLTLEQRCSSTITAAKMHPLIGPDLFPQCMSLPGPSSPTSRSCVTLGFPTRSVTHRQRVQVHVDNVPLPPARMTVNPIGRNPFRVRISWTPSPQETTKVLGYVVERHSEGGVKSQEIPFPKRSFDTGPLERGQSYQFSLRAKNEAGMSQPITARLTIPDGVPSAPPIKFTVTPAGNSSVRLSWRPPLPQHRNGKIVSYQGLYYAQRNPHAVQYFTTRDMSYTLTNLLKSTNYVFQIQALTSVGRGPWSNRQVIRL